MCVYRCVLGWMRLGGKHVAGTSETRHEGAMERAIDMSRADNIGQPTQWP